MIDTQQLVLISLIATEAILAYRIWKLERSMLKTMDHFIQAKNFLGKIQDTLSKTVDLLKKSKLRGKVSTKFGDFEGSIDLDHPIELAQEKGSDFFKVNT